MSLIWALADQLKQLFLKLFNNVANACSNGEIVTVVIKVFEDKIIARIQREAYLHHKNGTDVSHGCCPECYRKHKKI